GLLMEVVAGDGLLRWGREAERPPSQEALERPEALAFDRERSVLLLEAAFDDDRAASDDDRAVLAEEVGTDDRLTHPGLVLEGQEDEPLGGPRPLPHDDGAGGRDALSVGPADQGRGRENPPRGAAFSPLFQPVGS